MNIELVRQRVAEWVRLSYAFKKPPYSMKMLVEVRATHQRMRMVVEEISKEFEATLDINDIQKEEERTKALMQLLREVKNLMKQYGVLAETIKEALETKQEIRKEGRTT